MPGKQTNSSHVRLLRCVVEQKDPDVLILRVTQIKKILLMLMTDCCDKQSCAGDQKTQLVNRHLEFCGLAHRFDNNVHLFPFLHLLRRVWPSLDAPRFIATVNPTRESRVLNEFV